MRGVSSKLKQPGLVSAQRRRRLFIRHTAGAVERLVRILFDKWGVDLLELIGRGSLRVSRPVSNTSDLCNVHEWLPERVVQK
jgi:hypothetical protein